MTSIESMQNANEPDHDNLNQMLNQIWNDGDCEMKSRIFKVVERVFNDCMKVERKKVVQKPRSKSKCFLLQFNRKYLLPFYPNWSTFG